MTSQTTVLQVGGLKWATSASVAADPAAAPRVLAVEASAVSQTANVTSDPDLTNVVELSRWVRE